MGGHGTKGSIFLPWLLKVILCGKLSVGVVAFDLWLWKKSLFVGLRDLFCNGYESVKRHGGLVGCSECSGFLDCLSWLVINLVVVCCLKV